MSQQQHDKEYADFMSGSTVIPPNGSVFTNVEINSGPPMLRMIIMQVAFGFISKFQFLSSTKKAIMIGLVCCYFIYTDMNTFLMQRNQNVYELIGATRNSDSAFLKARLDLAKVCDFEMSEEACQPFASLRKRLNKTEIEDIRFTLVDKPNLRELYDKTEIFIRKKVENTMSNPSQGARYLKGFQELSGYSMFVIMMTLYVEKYQNFAKQMTIGSLLVFATISFYLKSPRDGDEENQIIQLVKRIPQLDTFTYFELSFIIKTIIYPMVFQAALFMSRMIDVDPVVMIREKLQMGQRVLSRSLVLCELMTDLNKTKMVPIQEQPKEIQTENNQPENAQVEENKEEEEDEPKEIVLDSLVDFGKADRHVLKAYEWVCYMRKSDTVGYMTNRIETIAKEQQSRTWFAKFGRFIRNLFILGVVSVLVGPTIYQTIAPQLGLDEASQAYFGGGAPQTEADITKAAQDRENIQTQRQKQKEKEFEDLYNQGQEFRDDL